MKQTPLASDIAVLEILPSFESDWKFLCYIGPDRDLTDIDLEQEAYAKLRVRYLVDIEYFRHCAVENNLPSAITAKLTYEYEATMDYEYFKEKFGAVVKGVPLRVQLVDSETGRTYSGRGVITDILDDRFVYFKANLEPSDD